MAFLERGPSSLEARGIEWQSLVVEFFFGGGGGGLFFYFGLPVCLSK